jgi:hypothetical protein
MNTRVVTASLAIFTATGILVFAAATSQETTDFQATINQSAVDKVLTSLTYPYTAFDGPGSADWGCFGFNETSELIRTLNSKRSAEYTADEVQLAKAINSAKEETDRAIQYLKSGKPLDGGAPPLADLIAMREFWEGKRSTVPSTLKGGCCLGLQYRLDHLLIEVKQRPDVSLGQARINIQSVNLYVKGAVSLRIINPFGICVDCWAPCLLCRCPYFCCSTYPLPQIRPSSDLNADGYLQPQVSASSNPEIGFFGHFDHLTLNWLKLVDWGWIVNHYVLKDKPLAKIPLSELGVNIALIQRRIRVSSMRFIDEQGDLPISITINVGRDSMNAANFNRTAISKGNYIWFNSVLKPSGLGSQPVTFDFTNQTIKSTDFTLSVPDAKVIFDPKASSATTTFSGGNWVTRVPSTGFAGNTFVSALSYMVPANLPGGIKNVSWSGTMTSDTPGTSLQWQWGAAVYHKFSSNHASLGVKPVDDNKVSQYPNSDHAGTPENFKSNVIGGATGGGGSNYTGGLSRTVPVGPF